MFTPIKGESLNANTNSCVKDSYSKVKTHLPTILGQRIVVCHKVSVEY